MTKAARELERMSTEMLNASVEVHERIEERKKDDVDLDDIPALDAEFELYRKIAARLWRRAVELRRIAAFGPILKPESVEVGQWWEHADVVRQVDAIEGTDAALSYLDDSGDRQGEIVNWSELLENVLWQYRGNAGTPNRKRG